MKKYMESIEDTKSENKDFIKEEMKDTQAKALNKVKSKEKSGKKYKRRIHYCNHDEGKPCTVEYI